MGSSRSAENRAKDFSISWPIKCSGWRARKPLVARVSRRSTTPNTSLNMSAMSMSATLAVGKVSLTSKCVASRVTARESVAIGPALFFVRLLRDADIRGFAPGTPPRAPRVAPPDARLTPKQSPISSSRRPLRKAQAAKSRCVSSPASAPRSRRIFPTRWRSFGVSEGYPGTTATRDAGRGTVAAPITSVSIPDRASSPVIAAVRTPPRALALPLAPRSRLFLASEPRLGVALPGASS